MSHPKFQPFKLRPRLMKVSRNQDSEEVVEDSEPERAQLRIRNRVLGQDTCHKKANLNEGTPETCKSIIQVKSLTISTAKVEITDSDSSSCSNHIEIVRNRSRFNEDVSASIPNLKRFAFSSSANRQKISTLNSSNCRSTSPPSGKRTLHAESVSRKATNSQLSLSDAARVFRCICCNVSWTSRKAAAQKLHHILRCARKYAYDDDTIRTLVKKEIESAPPLGEPKGKKPKSSEVISNSSTLFENLIQESAPKRRIKSQSKGSLAVGSSLRENMLTRARNIITAPGPDEIILDNITHDDESTSLPTESLLEGGSRHPRILNDQQVLQMGLYTQNFAASRLINGSSRSSLFTATHQDDDLEREYNSCLSRKESTPWCSYPSLSSRPVTIGLNVIYPEKSSNLILNGDPSDIQHNCYNKEKAEENIPLNVSQVGTKKLISRLDSKKKECSSSETENSGPFSSQRRTTSYKPRKSSSTKEHDTWESFMIQRIREDKELHLRVLRYEPVAFGVFLELAKLCAPSMSSGRLRLRLRNFLDKRAIQSYENVWRR